MAHARRAHARLGQPVVEPRRGAVAEVGADRLVDRREHLEQDEHDADERERAGEAVAALHRADEHAHRDREHRRQHAAQDEHDPPGDGERRSAFGRTPKNFHSLRSRRRRSINRQIVRGLRGV